MATKTKKQKNQPSQSEIDSLERHIFSLKLKTVAEYKEWCRANGFTANLWKNPSDRYEEQQCVKRKEADAALKKAKAIRKLNVVDEYSSGRMSHSDLPTEYSYLSQITWTDDLREAVKYFRSQSDVLVLGEKLDSKDNQSIFLKAFASIVQYKDWWINPLETWKPRSHNVRRQYASLLRHLFVKYDMPTFMDCVWYGSFETHKEWYIHIGEGNNIRTAQGLPVPLTKKAAHFFMQAPDRYSVYNAIRWGQIHAAGGDSRIANAVCGTKLGNSFAQEDFWWTVIKFFIDNPMLDTNQYGPIIDFIQNQRYDREEVVEGGRRVSRPPPQPNFTMKGRNPDTLVTQVEAWHKKLNKIKAAGTTHWPAQTDIKAFKLETNPESQNWKVWEIKELTTSAELKSEGSAMGHCVYSYTSSCSRGHCSIWSMTCNSKEGVQRQLTIEVNKDRFIVQARGKRNVKATVQQLNIMQRWADLNRLKISAYI